jgi:MICOS complex subunit MIC10
MSKSMRETNLVDRDSLTESQKWSYITDNTLKMMSFGFLCGGAISMVVFRSITSRAAITAFGTGCGIGRAYVDTKYVLGHDVAAETVWSAQVAPGKETP